MALLPYAAQSLIDLIHIKRLGVEGAANPLQVFVVLRVLGVSQGFEEILVAGCSSHVFRGTGAGSRQANGQRTPSCGGRVSSITSACCQ